MKRKRTKTKSFGVSKRESHDATQFYSSKLYEGIPKEKKNCNIIDNSLEIDKDLFGQAENFFELKKKLPKESLHLVLFMIPNIIYDNKVVEQRILKKVQTIVTEIKSLLINGGRFIVLINNGVDNSFFPLHAILVPFVIEEDLLMRGDIILSVNKEVTGKQIIKNVYNHAYIFSKNVFGRKKKNRKNLIERTDTIGRDEFLAQTKSIWKISSSKDSIYEYVPQLLHLFSFKEDIVMLITNEKEKREVLNKLISKVRVNRVISFY